MQDVTVKKSPKLPWHKQHSTSKRLILPANCKYIYYKETSETLHLGHSFVWGWNLDTWKSRPESPGHFLNVVLEKDRKDDWINWVTNKKVNNDRNILRIIEGRKDNWNGNIMHRNGLSKTRYWRKARREGRRGRRREQISDDLKERRRYWELKGEALDCTVCRTCFGSRYVLYLSWQTILLLLLLLLLLL